jgi:hypothetical protein
VLDWVARLPGRTRAEAIFGVATRIGPQWSEHSGAALMSLLAELKQHNVFRVAAAYGVVGWLLAEVASVVLPALHLPDWTLGVLIIVILAGIPLTLHQPARSML